MAVLLMLTACSDAPPSPPALLPGFSEALPALDRIVIEQSEERLVLLREGEHWRIDAAGWRADRRWLRPLLLGLAEARCDEPRTADPSRFGRIGVAWPSVPAIAEGEAFARPTGRLSFELAGERRQVIVGYPHPRGGAFVRVESAPHSCLTRIDLRMPARAADWFDPQLWAEPPATPDTVWVEDASAPALALRLRGQHYHVDADVLNPSPLADGLVAALLAPRQQGLRASAAGEDPPFERILRFESPASARYVLALRREGEQTWARVLAAPPRHGSGFAGREFLLTPDVAVPLWTPRSAFGVD